LHKPLEDTTAVAKKQICVNKRFQVYKIVWVAKETELRGRISKKGPASELSGGHLPPSPSVTLLALSWFNFTPVYAKWQ